MSRIKALTAGIFGLGLLLAACDSTDGGGAITESDLQGKWTVTSMHQKGTRKTTPTGGTPSTKNVDTTTTMPAGSSIEFMANKSLAISMGFPMTGTWKLSGANTVTTIVSFLGQADTSVMTATISGNQGTFVSHDVDSDDFGGVKTEDDFMTTVKATKQ